jgi:hypothetical protein
VPWVRRGGGRGGAGGAPARGRRGGAGASGTGTGSAGRGSRAPRARRRARPSCLSEGGTVKPHRHALALPSHTFPAHTSYCTTLPARPAGLCVTGRSPHGTCMQVCTVASATAARAHSREQRASSLPYEGPLGWERAEARPHMTQHTRHRPVLSFSRAAHRRLSVSLSQLTPLRAHAARAPSGVCTPGRACPPASCKQHASVGLPAVDLDPTDAVQDALRQPSSHQAMQAMPDGSIKAAR